MAFMALHLETARAIIADHRTTALAITLPPAGHDHRDWRLAIARDLAESVADFIRYECRHGRKPIIGAPADVDLPAFITQAFAETPGGPVVRPGDQIDPRINPRIVPTDLNFNQNATSTVPAFTFNSRAVWLNSFNFGMEFYY